MVLGTVPELTLFGFMGGTDTERQVRILHPQDEVPQPSRRITPDLTGDLPGLELAIGIMDPCSSPYLTYYSSLHVLFHSSGTPNPKPYITLL